MDGGRRGVLEDGGDHDNNRAFPQRLISTIT
jgi:hypothetical protein